MDIQTERYVRKPIYVDAVRVTEENFVALAAWCMGEIRTQAEELLVQQDLDDPEIPKNCFIRVRVHSPKYSRQTKAFIGDWLLYTEQGYKIYSAHAFKTAFQPVVEPDKKGVQAVTKHVK